MSQDKKTKSKKTSGTALKPDCDCHTKAHNCAIGTCSRCMGMTPSMGMSYCPKCADLLQRCAYCGQPYK